MTGTPIQLFCLKYLFGMPAKALDMYSSDNSGLNAQPLPDTLVSMLNRFLTLWLSLTIESIT